MNLENHGGREDIGVQAARAGRQRTYEYRTPMEAKDRKSELEVQEDSEAEFVAKGGLNEYQL